MKFKNCEIPQLIDLLEEMKLKGKQSRMRTRLIKLITQHNMEVFLPERDEMLNEYALKDEDGEMVLTEDRTGVVIVPELIPAFEKEFNELLNEELVIEENETNQEIILSVGQSLLECEVELNGGLATMFDSWCERFEDAIGRYGQKEELSDKS